MLYLFTNLCFALIFCTSVRKLDCFKRPIFWASLRPVNLFKKETLMMMMMIMNCYCGMVDWWKAFSLISSRDHCQRSSPSRISDTPQAGFEPAQNLTTAHYTTAPRRCFPVNFENFLRTPFSGTPLDSCFWNWYYKQPRKFSLRRKTYSSKWKTPYNIFSFF